MTTKPTDEETHMPAPMDWGDVAGVERVIRDGFAPRPLDDIKISIGPGPEPDKLEILAEEAAVPDVLHALAASGYPYRSEPVDERRRDGARATEPDSLAAADGILSIVVSRPRPPGYHWGDDPRLDWELLNTEDEATRTRNRLEFLRTGAPYPSRPLAAEPPNAESAARYRDEEQS